MPPAPIIANVASGAESGIGESEVFAAGLLEGRVALVTGGGTGLGMASAIELARCGARVAVVGRREEPLREAVAEIGRERASWARGDVRDRAQARALVAGALERWGRLDVLVNNAGGQYFTPAEGIAAKGWGAVWRLNVDGMLNMAEEAFTQTVGAGGEGSTGSAGLEGGSAASDGESGGTDGQSEETEGEGGRTDEESGRTDGECRTGSARMRRAGSAGGAHRAGEGLRIVNVTLSPHHGMPGMAHSGAARAAVEALTGELARRWAGAGATVCAVAAGHFDTEAMAKYPDVVRAGMARSVPMQRLGTVQEHAWLIALLASPLGGVLNGSTVTLDGARDNWFGPWPPPGLADSAGEVPVEERRGTRGRTAG